MLALVIAQYGHGCPEVRRAEHRDVVSPTAGLVMFEQKAIGCSYFDIVQREG